MAGAPNAVDLAAREICLDRLSKVALLLVSPRFYTGQFHTLCLNLIIRDRKNAEAAVCQFVQAVLPASSPFLAACLLPSTAAAVRGGAQDGLEPPLTLWERCVALCPPHSP